MKNIKEKFSHWLNYSPPGALSSKGWRLFKNEFRERAPIRYWFTNTAYRAYVLPVKWKYEEVCNWVRYRTYDQHHKLQTGLSPGYHGIETQMMNVNFNLLKDFVECELAWHAYAWTPEFEKERTWCSKHMPFYYKFKRWFNPFRSRKWAFTYFEWASKLDDTSLPPDQRSVHQAISAREIRDLYLWWVDSVPNRKTHERPKYSDQGLGSLSALDSDFNREEEDYKEYRRVKELNDELAKKWAEEDDEMIVRLVKIRRSLWT
jgi:hypothetical protein